MKTIEQPSNQQIEKKIIYNILTLRFLTALRNSSLQMPLISVEIRSRTVRATPSAI